MEDLSNATLAMFVVAAIAISVFGTMLSLSKLTDLSITGLLSTNTSATGYANLSVPASSFINLTDTRIDLGQLDVGARNTSYTKNDWWTVRNDGTVNISIRIYSTSTDDQNGNGTATDGRGPFSSTTTAAGCLNNFGTVNIPNACFTVACNSTQSGNSTNNTALCNTTYDALPINANGAASRLLAVNLSPTASIDQAVFGVNITVPEAEPAGLKEQDVTFLAAQS